MKEEIIIAGFGGQGVLSMGKILAYAGLMQDKEITWIPSYGPEQRGGTANVTVIVSDEKISSPILNSYDTAIILNQQSLDKFEKTVKPGGTLIYDDYGIIVTDIGGPTLSVTPRGKSRGLYSSINMFLYTISVYGKIDSRRDAVLVRNNDVKHIEILSGGGYAHDKRKYDNIVLRVSCAGTVPFSATGRVLPSLTKTTSRS